jgi:hypothetical protein
LRLTSAEGRFQTQASITNTALDLTGARLRLMSGYVGGVGLDYDAYSQAMADLGRSFSPASEGGLHLVAELPSTDVPKGGIRQVPLRSAGACYLKIADADPSNPPGAIIREIGLRRP